ncbi:MAG: ABC transporter substrate-binding protein [Vicinamibacterales bacterium]
MTARVLLVLAGFLSFPACDAGTGGAGDGAAAGPILIGAPWPWEARKNLLYGQGLDMALEEINGAGGIHGRFLQILREDDRETVDQGRIVAQKLAANPNVVAVIGHLQSFITVPAAAIYDLAGVALLTPTSTDPGLTEQGYKMVFRATFTDRQVGSQMASLALARKHRRVAIYYIRDRYGRGLANAFEETFGQNGGLVMDRQSYDPSGAANSRPLAQLVDDWKGRELDAIFIAGEAPQAALFIAEAHRRGLRVPVLGGDALGTPELFAVDHRSVEGVTIATPFHPDDSRPEVRRFDEAFQRRYGRRPDTAAALAYDSLRLLAEGIRRARAATRAEIGAGLRTVSKWPGVTGAFTFDEAGDLVSHPLVTAVARDGRFAFVPNGAADAHE